MSTKGTLIPDWLAVPFAGITPAPSQEKGQDLFPTGNWRFIRPVYRDKMPPCNKAEEHTSELQSQFHLVCRLLLEKKNKQEYCAGQCSTNLSHNKLDSRGDM